MNKSMKKLFTLVCAAGLLFLSPSILSLHASEFDPRFTSISEEAGPEPRLRFAYRLWPFATVTETAVEANGQPLEFVANAYADNPLNKTALLILVDTSVGLRTEPNREGTLAANRELILEILNTALPRTQIGLYEFANDLVELAPLGTPFAEIREKVPELKATGRGTRIYRRAMDAIEKLASMDAKRKALLIFSDGKDEDTGFTLQNLQETAEKAGVIVMAVGCPEEDQFVPALGNLERIAADTMGIYLQTVPPPRGQRGSVQNPPGAAKAILNSLDGGGEVFASLAEVEPGAIVTVRLTTEEGQTLEKILEREAPEPAEGPTPEPAEEQPDPSTAKAQEAQEDSIADPTSEEQAPEETEKSWAEQNLIWVLVAAGGLLVCIILIAVALRKPAAPPAAALPETWTSPGGAAESARSAPLAYLVMQDAEASRLAISQTATRIGRRSDNDIVFSNDSVSGHHAEIHMGRDGTFTITDLGSGNGVLVNGQPAKQVGLRDGDIVELGEVRFRFTLQKA
jgi:hypothetical protein